VGLEPTTDGLWVQPASNPRHSGDLHVLNERDHPVAHFHAYHAGRRASVSADGVVLAGSLEPRALGFVQEWARLDRDEIVADWERARRNEPLLAIPPLP
jgi:Domain of unknown function (DUF4160)